MISWNGAQGRNRTTDTVIFSHVLYQLSYLGAVPDGRRLMPEMPHSVQTGGHYASSSSRGASSGASAAGMR